MYKVHNYTGIIINLTSKSYNNSSVIMNFIHKQRDAIRSDFV